MRFTGEPNPAEQALSPTLGILPLKDRVLLPSSAMKLVLTHSGSPPSRTTCQPGNRRRRPTVSVVPLRRDPELDAEAAAAHAAGEDRGSSAAELRERLHDVGAAARIVQVARGLGPGGARAYTLLLEGRCRFQLSRLLAEEPFLLAAVTQLESLGVGGAKLFESPDELASAKAEPDPELASMANARDSSRRAADKLEHLVHARRLEGHAARSARTGWRTCSRRRSRTPSRRASSSLPTCPKRHMEPRRRSSTRSSGRSR